MMANPVSCGYRPVCAECVNCPLTWSMCPNMSRESGQEEQQNGRVF
ncbi:MAG: hypothetical protein NHB15_06545 [Methanosarcina barkeri]|nr:hypothetical protein [Methanosarcina sp. ERenArc_MAG2]MCO5381783.1 hypothetical protein [Methanosarcina sp. ERenArc_MAG2]